MVPLLIIDDLGMRKLAHTAAEDLLELIMRRYERASTLLTSNRPVDDWGEAPRRHGRSDGTTRSPAASRACAQMRATELANEGPYGLAVGRHRAVELNRPRSRSPEMAGFEVSTNGRFCSVHRGLHFAFSGRRTDGIVVSDGEGRLGAEGNSDAAWLVSGGVRDGSWRSARNVPHLGCWPTAHAGGYRQ